MEEDEDVLFKMYVFRHPRDHKHDHFLTLVFCWSGGPSYSDLMRYPLNGKSAARVMFACLHTK
jgi:hypothetical protein